MLLPLYGSLGPLGRKYGGAALWSGWSGLTHCWHLDELSGTRADSFGTAHLTDVNTVGYAAGKHNNAASFVAANSELLTNAAPVTTTMNGTLSFWAYIDPTHPNDYYFWYSEASALWVRGYTVAGALVYADTQMYDGAYPLAAANWWEISLSGWANIVATWTSGGALKVYANGVAGSVVGAVAAGGPVSNPAYGRTLGGSGANYMTGYMDATHIWDRGLSAAEVVALWNSGAGRFYPD